MMRLNVIADSRRLHNASLRPILAHRMLVQLITDVSALKGCGPEGHVRVDILAANGAAAQRCDASEKKASPDHHLPLIVA
jgi:hypothetical protein